MGRRYRVRYRDPDHDSREKNGFVRRRDAEDYLANVGSPPDWRHPRRRSPGMPDQIRGRQWQAAFGNGTTHLRTPTSGHGWFWSAVRKCQKIDRDFPTVTPHDLRHAAASMAISARANPKAVQRMLGHGSAAMTLDAYADLFEDDLDAVSDRLNAMRKEAVVGFLWEVGS